MNPNLTEILFLLDKSGSMGSIQNAALEGFNQFIKDQARQEGTCLMTLALFSDKYEEQYASIPLQEAVPLDFLTYFPQGQTALHDSIVRGINGLVTRISQRTEQGLPAKVIVVILTDGEENGSKSYGANQARLAIELRRKYSNWEFLFLGANQNACLTAKGLGMEEGTAIQFTPDSQGIKRALRQVSDDTTIIRQQGQ
jgi:uncharacterized protein YegL